MRRSELTEVIYVISKKQSLFFPPISAHFTAWEALFSLVLPSLSLYLSLFRHCGFVFFLDTKVMG